jgi:putative ABC transport system permease protein
MSGRWLALWSRALRSEPIRTLGVAGLIVVTVLFASSVPRVLALASDQALRQEAESAPAVVRNLELDRFGRIGEVADDPLRLVDTMGIALREQYPDPIPALTRTTETVVDTPLWHPSSGTPLDSVLNLRIQSDVEPHLRLVSGRLPSGATKTIADPSPGASPGSELVVLEVATSTQTADKLQVPLGGRLILEPEPSDPLAASRDVRIAIDLVGTYEVIDPDDPFWMNDQSVDHTYTYALSGFTEYVGATMLMSADAYPALMDATRASGLPMTYRWRSYIDPARLESSQLDDLTAALRRAETLFPPANPALAGGALGGPDLLSPAALQTGLLGLVEAHQARWQSGEAILAILWTGVAVVILASLALVAEAMARRRGSSVSIVDRRGASAGQLRSAIVGEALVLVLPAVLVGTILAIVLVPAGDLGPTLLVAGAIALAAIVLLAGASLRQRRSTDPSRTVRSRRSGSGRLVAEALIVGLAVVGAISLRGANGADSSVNAETNPLLALAPALVGLAAGIIVVRGLPLVLRPIGSALARGRGLVAVLGVWRATREGSISAVMVVALTATMVGTFASALLDRINSGTTAASWQLVGADFQISGRTDDLAAFETRTAAGIESESPINVSNVSVSTGGARSLVVVDPSSLGAVASGTPAQPGIPAALAGAVSGSVPALVSGGGEGTSPIAAGQTFTIWLGGTPVSLRAVAVEAEFPAAPAGQPFIVVSRTQLAAILQEPPIAPTAILVRAPGLSIDQMNAVASGLPTLSVQGRAATESNLRSAPIVTAVSLGIAAGALAVLIYGMLTVVLAIGLATASRRNETARLQILGLSNGQAVVVVVLEYLPAVVVGVVVGLGVGILLVEFVGPGLGLPAVLGVADLLPSAPDIGRLAVPALITLALVAGATVVSTVLERRRQLATALRDGTQ